MNDKLDENDEIEFEPGTVGYKMHQYLEECSLHDCLYIFVNTLADGFLFPYEKDDPLSAEFDAYVSYTRFLENGNTIQNAIIKLKNNINVAEQFWIQTYAKYDEYDKPIEGTYEPFIFKEIFRKYFPVDEFPELWI